MKTVDYYAKAVEVVSDVTGIEKDDIVSKKRQKPLVDARCIIVMLMTKAGYYPNQISEVMGISVRWVQKISETFRDRLRFRTGETFETNFEEASNKMRTH